VTNNTGIMPIHPFPARMAPEVALAEVRNLPPGSVVLDPMVGSGTVVRIASEQKHRSMGYDMDPLAVLMASAWTTPVDVRDLRKAGENIANCAEKHNTSAPVLPWIDSDKETQDYVDFWFAQEQQDDLRKISALLIEHSGALGNALRIALSRLIITKDRGASLARDVSHSRPHRVRDANDFPVIKEFRRSVEYVASRLEQQPPPGDVQVLLGDARTLSDVESGSIDAVITSPPYLNAIDYMRGHRLSLVWLGYSVGELRDVRCNSVGAERMLDEETAKKTASAVLSQLAATAQLPNRERRILERYALDVGKIVAELHRVIRAGGKAILVVGNSCLKGVFIENSLLVRHTAGHAGFTLSQYKERELPPNKRYLPPPSSGDGSSLEKRMRTESVLTFLRP